MNIHTFDIRLLVVFDALLSTKSVSKAAHKLCRTQSAVSHSLSILRHQLKDELLIRKGNIMEPTPRALELAEPVRAALKQLEDVISEGIGFDQATSNRTFHIGMSDYVSAILLPELMSRISEIVSYNASRKSGFELVDSGSIDIALGIFPKVSAKCRLKKIMQDRFVCAVRSGHPLSNRKITLDDYIEFPHVLVSLRSDNTGLVDEVLSGLGKYRRVAVAVPYFLVAPKILESTDYILTVSERVIKPFLDDGRLKLLNLPFELPDTEINMLWDRRFDSDSSHIWLRQLITDVTSTI